jgi:hypothetical protein
MALWRQWFNESSTIDPPIRPLQEALALDREIKADAFAGSDGCAGIPSIDWFTAMVTSLGVGLIDSKGQVVRGP